MRFSLQPFLVVPRPARSCPRLVRSQSLVRPPPNAPAPACSRGQDSDGRVEPQDRNRSRRPGPPTAAPHPGPATKASSPARPEWRAAFRNASWATRNRHRAASEETESGRASTLSSIALARCRSKRSASAFKAAASPRSSRIEGCSRYESACTSSLNRINSSRTDRPVSSRGGAGIPTSLLPTSMASRARRWVMSSCNSRARRARSSSCAPINRALKLRRASSACFCSVMSRITPNRRTTLPVASCSCARETWLN